MTRIARTLALSLVTLTLITAAIPALSQTTPADAFWEAKYHHAGLSGTVRAMLSRPGELIVGGSIDYFEDTPIANIASLQTSGGVVTGVTAMGEGFDNTVYALGEYQGQIVAAGYFERSGDTVLNGIASWDGAAWQPLGDGLPGAYINAVVEYDGKLFAENYAWDGVSWTDFFQTNGGITELIVHDGLLFVGGSFSEARGIPVNMVFAWDGENVIPLGEGFANYVISAVSSPEGPIFATASDVSYGKVYRWDGAGWVVERENSVPHSVGYYDGEIFVSNSLFISPHYYLPYIQSNGSGSWVTQGTIWSGVMVEHEGVLFIQASSGSQSGVMTPGLAVFDGVAMREAFSTIDGYSKGFEALATFGSGVVLGGDFTIADGQEFDGAGLSAGGTWTPWGDRSALPTGTGQGPFTELEVLGTEVFGMYSYLDWDVMNEVLVKAVWSGTAWEWQTLPHGGVIYGDLVAAGSELFHLNYGEVNSVDPILGTRTPVPGLDLDGRVLASCAHQGDLVICGDFTTNSGAPVSNILRHTGGSWQDVGAPLPGPVGVIAPMDGTRIAAVVNSNEPRVYDRRVALFDGAAWTILDGVFDGTITALQYHRGRLFAAGYFHMVDKTPVNRIAVWTGTKWVAVGRGLEVRSYGARVDMASAGDHLWVIGDFSMAGGHLSVGLAEWTGDPAMLTGDPSGVPDDLPARTLFLAAPYPNPFNPMTTVSFAVPYEGTVRIAVYDVGGKLVRVLTDEPREAGAHEVTWDGRDEAGQIQPAGVYFARMEADGIHEAVKLTLVK